MFTFARNRCSFSPGICISQLVINSALFWAVGYFTHTYSVEGVIAIFFGPILMGFFTTVLSLFVRD